jgi:DNA-binding XRE family transcriptional regulator
MSKPREAAKLLKIAKENPWHLFTQAELAQIMGISEKGIRAMKNARAPFVFDKSTPQLLTNWIAEGHAHVGKTS